MSIKDIRQQYQNIIDHTNNNDLKNLPISSIKNLQTVITQKIEKDNQSQNFQNLQQLLFYQQKVGQVRQAYVNASKNKKRYSQLAVDLKKILKNDKYKNERKGVTQQNQQNLKMTHSTIVKKPLKQYASPQHSSAIEQPEQLLGSFFSQKKSQVPFQSTFKTILQTAPVTNKPFRKKIASNNYEIEQLKQKNYDLKRKLETLYPVGEQDFNKNQEIRRIQRRMLELESQNQRLNRQNTTLKSQQGSSAGYSQISNYTVQQMLDAKYRFQTLQNDLQKINAKFQDGLSSYYPKNSLADPEANRFYGRQSKFDSLSQIKQDRDDMNNNSLSFYQMQKSYFSEASLNPNQSYHLGIENGHTVKKNKVAFFKQSGVLIKDKYVDIAFKRINTQLTTNNVIKLYLYIHDKTGENQNVSISYDYETNYFDIRKIKELKQIQKYSQGRQSIQISLSPLAQDLNSHATALVTVGQRLYKIWLPILFIEIKQFTPAFVQQNTFNEETKTIKPHQAFNSAKSTQKYINFMEIEDNCGKLWAVSKNSSGPIILTWKGNQLQIKTSTKWIDAVSFVFLEFI